MEQSYDQPEKHNLQQFMVYEQLKLKSDKSIPSYIALAALSKVIATCTTYPYQVVKSRMQFENQLLKEKLYTSSWGTIVSVWKGEGVRGFYKGLAANVVRVLPGTCITFAVYEGLVKTFEEFK